MAYPIPNDIAYEEKIAFNLTTKQLVYAVVFGLVALQAYTFLKQILPEPMVFLPSILIGTTGLSFMYLGMEERLRDIITYHTGVKSGGYYDKRVRNFVEINSIEDNTIFLKNGQMRAVLQINPINFTMYDEERKRAVTTAFASFLHQLDQPIQLHARTVNVDLAEYFDNGEKKIATTDKSLLPLYQDFRKYEEDLISEKAIRNRLFYAIIPLNDKTKDRSKRLEMLADKVKIIQEGMADTGLVSERLNSEQLVSFVSSYFEERLAVGDDYLSQKTLLKNYVEEREGAEPKAVEFRKKMLQDLMCPNRIETKPDHIKVNETYYRTVMGVGYPREVENGWLDRLISTRDNYDITIHIDPSSIESAKVMLHNQIVKEEADYSIATMKGMPNPSLANKLGDTKEFFNWLDRGEQRLFSVSIYVMCKARSKEQLDYLTNKCKADLNSVSIIPKIPYYRMAQAMQSSIPLGIDKIKKTREFPTSSLAATFPFISSTPEIEHNGILLAHDRNNSNPIIRDQGNLSNLHTMILAKSGAGKSYTAKLLISRMLMKGTRTFIIDPSGEYLRMCEHYGGQIVKISRESETVVNPLDLFGEKFADKRISLMGLFSIICGGLSPAAEGTLDKVLKETYWSVGISEDETDENIAKIKPPKMSNLLEELERQLDFARKHRMYDQKRTLQALITRIEKYCKGGVYSFVDRHTNLDVKRPFIVFDIKDLPEEVKSMYMYMILDFITNMTKNDLERKAIVIDEGWSLLNQEKSAEHLLWLIKTSRKFNTGLTFITQEVNDLLGNKVGESILANTATKILLAQDNTTIGLLSEVLHLNAKERNFLTMSKIGDGLLILENLVRVPVSIKASPKEHELITTNPEEVMEIEKRNGKPHIDSPKTEIQPTNDFLPNNGEDKNGENIEKCEFGEGIYLYKTSEIAPARVNKLKMEGYEEVRKVPYGNGGGESFLVKPRNNESTDHAFFVRIIENEIRKYTDKIELLELADPDISFDSPIGRIAVEVETGSRKDSEEKMASRFGKLKNEYSGLLIFVTDKDLKHKYGKHGKTITRTQICDTIKSYFENGAIGGREE